MGLGCHLCPRACGADRRLHSQLAPYLGEGDHPKGGGGVPFCGAPYNLEVASVCVHRGEEPPLNPIVNIFFAHCNLQCIYCQNHQISKVENGKWGTESPETIADKVCQLLTSNSTPQTPLVGFVTAAHYADRIPEIVDAIRHNLPIDNCQQPIFVYNSSGYESVDTLRSLEGFIDIYLPDYKYADSQLASTYSHAPDYPDVADTAIREMIRQVGIGLKVDTDGTAYRGLIVRHLVLPGHVDNSLQVLDRLVALASDLSPFTSTPLHLSLMAQYYPPRPGLPSPLDRPLTQQEYDTVVAHAVDLGLTAGWIQQLTASDNYCPDFTNDNPFEANILTH